MLLIISGKGTVTGKELAEHFEVSLRTIYRDNEKIGEAGIPVASSSGKGGGYYIMDSYKDFLADYGLSDVIKNSNAIILGASAGALNMSAQWLSLNDTDHEVETGTIYEGMGFDQFAYESHSKRGYATFVQGYLFPLSEEIDVYAAEQESAIRVKDGKIETMGPIYLISRSKIQKLVETL
ncbi:HTH domain-containing protein [Paenibacillus sp. FSL R7-0312]|nr:HTH domain-containing protein [Paenibacillus sp. FSL R5-0912]